MTITKTFTLKSGFFSFVWFFAFFGLSCLFFTSCKMAPAVVRTMYPVAEFPAEAATNFDDPSAVCALDGLTIRLTYVDRAELFRLSRLNPDPSGPDGLAPVLTVFAAEITNAGREKAAPGLADARLVDVTGKTQRSLNFEAFKAAHSPSVEGTSGFRFLFNNSFIRERGKRNRALTIPLFRGTNVPPSSGHRAFLVFDQSSEFSPVLTIVLPSVTVSDSARPAKPGEMRFKFVQRLKRREAAAP